MSGGDWFLLIGLGFMFGMCVLFYNIDTEGRARGRRWGVMVWLYGIMFFTVVVTLIRRTWFS